MSRRSPSRSLSDVDYERDREKERERRRREWMILQEKEREHERLKRKKIEEYERKRAEMLKQESLKRREPSRRSRSYSRSRSNSEERHRRNYLRATSSNAAQVMSQKLNSSEGNKPFFKGPEETMKIKEEELREITVKIKRKIPGPATGTSEIRRDIVNPEDITLKRREEKNKEKKSQLYCTEEGNAPVEDLTYIKKTRSDYETKWLQTSSREGVKPIFDRDELKNSEIWTTDIEERTIVAAGKNSPAKKSQAKQRSASLSPRRHRSPSPQSRSYEHSHRSRRDEQSRRHSEDRYKEHRRTRDHSHSREGNRDDSRRRRERSYSKERSSHRSDRNYSRSSRSEKDYRDYRGRSKSYDRHDRLRDSPRERHLSTAAYVEPMPFLYYGGYAPRPVFVGPPMPPMRGPLVRGPFPPMPPMGPHYRPRPMGPQNAYRAALPPDSRYGRM